MHLLKNYPRCFEEYALRGGEELLPLAGLIGTLATFGLAWELASSNCILPVMMHPGTQMIQIIRLNTGLN